VGEPLIINGEEFKLKPLSLEELPLFFKVMKAFSGASDKNASPEEMLKNVDDDGLSAMKQIIQVTLEKSYPDDKEGMEEFGLKYMNELLGKIMEINSSSTAAQSKVAKLDQHLKGR